MTTIAAEIARIARHAAEQIAKDFEAYGATGLVSAYRIAVEEIMLDCITEAVALDRQGRAITLLDRPTDGQIH